ncbi:MAG: hypothetical protein HUK20_07625 [Fibrobacter sp.]|nr:hypothetical protein [Fibrobacter sp.]
MNFENVNVLSKKIEGVLGTIRALKVENAKLSRELVSTQSMLQDKAMLLETANANLLDCKAELNDRENRVNAQDESINSKTQEIQALSYQVTDNANTIASLNTQMSEKDAAIASLNAQMADKEQTVAALNALASEKDTAIATLNGIIADKDKMIASLNAQAADRDSCIDQLNVKLEAKENAVNGLTAQTKNLLEAKEKIQQEKNLLEREVEEKVRAIEALKADLVEKESAIEEMNVQLQAQNEEIAEAQEKFQQLVATIESELGTEFMTDAGVAESEGDLAEEPESASDIIEEEVEGESIKETVGQIIEGFETEGEDTLETQGEPSTGEFQFVAEEFLNEDDSLGEGDAPATEDVEQPSVEEDVLSIEVHGANEKSEEDGKKKSENLAGREGSQTNFFG